MVCPWMDLSCAVHLNVGFCIHQPCGPVRLVDKWMGNCGAEDRECGGNTYLRTSVSQTQVVIA